jgi:hypothetical protein
LEIRISSGLVAFFLDLGKGHDAGGLKCVAARRRCVSRPADGEEEAVDGRHGAQEGWMDPARALLPWRRWPPEAAALCVFLDARRVPSDESVGL